MSELTKIEELKDRRVKSWDDYRQMKVIAGEAIQFAEQMARELLSLREPGDEELALIGERFQCAETEYHRIQAYKDLEAAAIARGQKLSEAREEIERLKRENDSGISEGDPRVCSHGFVDLTPTDYEQLQSQIATLTAELAALKSAPGMEEVDALAYWPDHEFKSQQYTKIQQLADLARRSIASREEVEEVVGLLRWLDEFWDFKEVKKCLCEYASDKVYGDGQQKARRILEIVEGK